MVTRREDTRIPAQQLTDVFDNPRKTSSEERVVNVEQWFSKCLLFFWLLSQETSINLLRKKSQPIYLDHFYSF